MMHLIVCGQVLGNKPARGAGRGQIGARILLHGSGSISIEAARLAPTQAAAGLYQRAVVDNAFVSPNSATASVDAEAAEAADDATRSEISSSE